MKKYLTLLKKIGLYLSGLILILFIFFWLTTYHPKAIQSEPFHNEPNTPTLKLGQKLKIMSWNVQFMAGKNYTFIYDVIDELEAPHDRPSSEDIHLTLDEVARVIIDEDPDVVLLQEVDEGAKRTDYQDQLEELLNRLPKAFNNFASSYYWKSSFVPHPRILGSVGMKLSTISKYRISEATRYQLPLIPYNFVVQNYSFKRAVLEVRLPIENSDKAFVALNVHTDAFAQGYDTMNQQIEFIDSELQRHESNDEAWCIGGDFNLLPPGQYQYLNDYFKADYSESSELTPMLLKYSAIPSMNDLNSDNKKLWFTHLSNNPRATELDRTLDYIFYSKKLKLLDSYVRQQDTLKISDHCPVIGVFTIN